MRSSELHAKAGLMKKSCASTTLITLFLISSLAHGADASSSAELAEIVQSECGYALEAPFLSAVSRWRIEDIGSDRFRMHIEVQPKSWSRRTKVDVVLDCARPVNGAKHHREAPPASEPISTRAILELEDSGGRYGRHVAFEQAISGTNWHGTVAYIDSVFGDGVRTRQSALVACDEKIERPCIAAQLSPTRWHSQTALQPIVELIRSIAHTR